MKISADELGKMIWLEQENAAACKNSDNEYVANARLAIATELQQLRDERRWRGISELSEESAPQFFQLSDGKSVNPMPFWLMDDVLCTWAEDPDGMGDVSIEMAQEWYTHFRPLPMDLPEDDKCR